MERQGNLRGHVRGRRWTAGVLAGVAVLLAVIALVLTYLGRAVLRPEPFADRAVAALRHPAVRADLADHLTTVVLQVGGEDLVAVRPLIRSVAGVIVGSQAFAALFRHAVLVAHDRVVDGHGRTLALTIGDLGVLVQGALQKFAPGAAATIAAQRIPTLLSYRPDGRLLAAIRTAKHAYSAAWVLAVLAALAAAGGLALSPDRRRTVLQLGIGLLVGGLAIAALVTVGRAVAVNAAAPGRGAVVDAVWNVFLSGLRVQALVLAAGGAICAACAFVSGRTARHAAKAADARSLRRWRTHRVLPVAVALTAFVAMVLVLITGGGDEAPAATPRTCNGYRVLCNRRLNEVALAATHNSMASTTIRHWLFAQQDGTISDQLNQGIHGLLIDSYYGFAEPNGIVRTDLARVPKLKDLEQEIGPQATQAALRIRSRLEPSTRGKPGIFLCHGFCELGSITLASALEDLRTFLVNNPNEVVVVINQDEGVTPTDIEHAFGRAGLLDLVYRGPLGPFPTLRQMIDSNQRLVVMAENDAGDVPWYQLAYQHALQETPFRFRNADQLTDPAQLDASCRPNRGPSTAPLFLLNHWVDTSPTPRPSLAAIVNAEPKLLARVRTCERIRDHLPNLVAVDFYRRGGVLAVVNALNGIGR
jgi:hypothetical protein